MNKQGFNSTQRFSVNTSFSTLKNCQHSHQQNTSTKNIQNKRFSYQENHHYTNTSQKENLRNNFVQHSVFYCLNHSNKQAQYLALESSNDPMHLCQRCAILVASKGFEIKKMQEMKETKVKNSEIELKKQIKNSFTNIKQQRKLTLQKLQVLEKQLLRQQSVLQDYFLSLQRFLQMEKQSFYRQIMSGKKQIQNMKNQSNQYYLKLLQKVKSIGQQDISLSQDMSSEIAQYLKELSRARFKVDTDKAQVSYKLKPLQQITQQLHIIVHSKQAMNAKAFRNFQLKNEENSSPARSLKLSFEEEINEKQFLRKNLHQKGTIQNFITSIEMF